MAYHKKKIQKGVLGEASKIIEEFNEFIDAHEQGNSIMRLIELSDLIGAIELYTINHHNISLNDLIRMKDATKSAFEDGERK